jgi:hypothetical protein
VTPTQRHRGKHPSDGELFAAGPLETLREAAADLSWLLDRGYQERSALKLVGDRHQLRGRQREALSRSVAGPEAVSARRERAIDPAAAAGESLVVDALNCLITVEAALAGGMVLVGLDGAWRDLASVHGTWRRVAETDQAIDLIGAAIAAAGLAAVRWLVDRPVSNSGRLAARLRERAAERGWSWEVATATSPDREIIDAAGSAIAASSDSWILDSCQRWIDLPRAAIEGAGLEPWIVCVRAP